MLDRARSELANALSKDDAKRERESEREKREEKERREREVKIKIEKEEKNKEKDDKKRVEEHSQTTIIQKTQAQEDNTKKPEESACITEVKECNEEKKVEVKAIVKDNCTEEIENNIPSNKQESANESDSVGQSS